MINVNSINGTLLDIIIFILLSVVLIFIAYQVLYVVIKRIKNKFNIKRIEKLFTKTEQSKGEKK